MFMKVVHTCTHKGSFTLFVHRSEKKNTSDPVHCRLQGCSLVFLEKGYCEMDLVFVYLVVPIFK